MSLAGAYLSVHTPRYCTLEAAFEGKLASEVFRPVRDGLVAQGREVARARLDAVVINSCHLISTFPTVVDGTPRHQGVLTAQEAPEIIHGVGYDIPGDYELAAAIVARESGKRVGFVASGSVSHKLVRGPEKGPQPEDEELDHRLAKMLAAGQYAELWAWLPEFCRATQAEMGGRHLAMLMGAVIESKQRFGAAVHAYGPSSGSGNYVVSLTAEP
jgi:aromatic ring-opening dioxygenase catalytic subunit (LigB family)